MIALMLTMLASLILGMGLPTAAAYILVATLAAPALVNMGVDILAAHMFVFYSAMLSAITPPVALAAFAAAAISRENPMRIALTAVKYGLVAFIIPYFFVFDTRLLGQGDFPSLIVPIVTAALGTVALASALQGWLADKANMFIRAVLFSSAMLLIAPGIITDAIGLITIAVVLAYQIRTRNNRKFSIQGSPLDTQNE